MVLASEYDDLAIHWEQAAIALPITDARSVREPIVLASGDGTTLFEAGGARVAGFGPLLVAPYAALGLGPLTAPQAFSFELVLDGTGTLEFLPFGDETRVALKSNWPSPSFAGAYCPNEREVQDDRFHGRVARARSRPRLSVALAAFRSPSPTAIETRRSACSSSLPSASTKRRCARRSTAC